MRISDWSSDVCSSDLMGSMRMAKPQLNFWLSPRTLASQFLSMLTRYQSYSRQNRPNHQQERCCSPRKFNRHDGSTFTIIRRLAPNQRRGQFYHHLQFVDELQRTWKPCI